MMDSQLPAILIAGGLWKDKLPSDTLMETLTLEKSLLSTALCPASELRQSSHNILFLL